VKALAVWPRRRQAGIVEHEEPRLTSPTGVRIRTLEVGVCGTDAEICSFVGGVPPDGSEYLIAGHEGLGRVDEVGPAVFRFGPGDLVVPSVRRPCPRPECAACRTGEQDFCLTGQYTERGIKGAHGFLAEYVVEEERYLHRVPAALRDIGVLTEPLTIAEKALRQYLAVQRRLPWKRDADDAALLAGTRAIVLGAGPVGILGCMLLLHRGCHVWVYSRAPKSHPNPLLVQSLGATYVSSEDLPFGTFAAAMGGPELVYEATGAPALVWDVVEHLAPNAVLVLTGVPAGEGRMTVPGASVMRRIVLDNLAVLGTVNANPDDFAAAIEHLGQFFRTWPDAVRGVVTGRHPLEDFCVCALERKRIKEVITV
jgi:threonine dehydrogenase-like Zn-dependent dehydrogenase